MNNFKTKLGVCLLTVLIGGYSVHAADLPARGPIPFSAYDADSSGVVSEAEFNTTRQQRMASQAAAGRTIRGASNANEFSLFDTDKDGQLSPQELANGQSLQMKNRQGMGQGQGGGQGMGRNMPAYSDYDLNGDGKVTENEFVDARNQRIAQQAKQGYPMKNIGNMPAFTDLDSNSDETLSAEEFAAHQSQRSQQSTQ